MAAGVTDEDVEEEIVVHLFRRVLRLHDNEALSSFKPDAKFIGLFIFHEKELDPEILGVNRLDFLLQSLNGLAEG